MEYEIVMNLHRHKDKKYLSRHYKHPTGNHTLCGLSMKKGHAWDISKAKFVTCSACLSVVYDKYNLENANDNKL
jgi:hypothetical protein